jgi:hypothetical protein
MAAAAPARKPSAAPARPRKRPTLSVAPARKPARKSPARRPGGQLIPIAVGTATAVRNLPDSSLMVRMTRGRAWIAVLGMLLAGIVALNVMTLSFAASSGHIAQNIQALEEDNSVARSRDAQKSGAGRIRQAAAEIGLSAAAADQIGSVQASPQDVETAARRLAAAAAAY